MDRRAEVAGATVAVISAIAVVASSFWVSNIAPYLLGLAGGALHAIAAHERGVLQITWIKFYEVAFVSLFGGWVGLKIANNVSFLTEYSDVLMVVGGFLSWEMLMLFFDRKDSLAKDIFNKIDRKGEKEDG